MLLLKVKPLPAVGAADASSVPPPPIEPSVQLPGRCRGSSLRRGTRGGRPQAEGPAAGELTVSRGLMTRADPRSSRRGWIAEGGVCSNNMRSEARLASTYSICQAEVLEDTDGRYCSDVHCSFCPAGVFVLTVLGKNGVDVDWTLHTFTSPPLRLSSRVRLETESDLSTLCSCFAQ